jgi:cytochrome P450 family 9
MRQCNRDYVINLENGKKITLKDGDNLVIPVKSIQHDERYFENPEKFDPHRFDDDRKDSIPSGAFIPFGSGPRVCIGSRFALMEVKLLVFYILSKLELDVCEKTPSKIELANTLGTFEFKESIFVEYKLRG